MEVPKRLATLGKQATLGFSEDTGVLGSRGTPGTLTGSWDVWAQCLAFGGGLKAAASLGFLSAYPVVPPFPTTLDNQGVSPTGQDGAEGGSYTQLTKS